MMSLIWIAFAMLALAAALADLLTFRIPNAIVIALLTLFLVAAVIATVKHARIPWLNHVGAAALTFAVGLFLYGLGQMGAGDAKLLTVVALWAGLSQLVPLLLALAVSALGFLIIVLILRRVVAHLDAEGRIWGKLPRVLKKGEGIPYGVGIMVAAIITSHGFPSWLWQM